MTYDEAKMRVDLIEFISSEIKPLLAGHRPEIQGAVLVNLTALWLAGHHPDLRGDLYVEQMKVILELVPSCEKEIFGDAGFPVGGVS